MRWKGPALALLGAGAVAGIAIGFTLGGGDGTTITDASGTTNTGGGSRTASTTTGTGTGTSTTLVQLPKPGDVRPGHRLTVATVDDAVRQTDPKVAAQLMKVSHDAELVGIGDVADFESRAARDGRWRQVAVLHRVLAGLRLLEVQLDDLA
ncbi:MAG TPA: hypothetical protein VK496_06225, partial [Gaiellaceae bacterium]|nr:hypothetical protein [Gaiellaceae bacterium]